MKHEILQGHAEICRVLDLPWPVIARLAMFGGLPVQDLDGPAPSLAVNDWLAWQRWDSAGGEVEDEFSATA